jgi:hypothetical protein
MPRLWKPPVTTQTLTDIHKSMAVERLGLELLELGEHLRRARQHDRILHGGVSPLLAPQGAA